MEQVSNKFDDEIPQKSGPRVRSTSSPISSFMGKKIKPESGRPARLDTSLNVTGGKSPGILIPFEDSTPTPVGTLLTTGTSISSEESEVDSNSIGPDGLPLAKAHSLKENSKRERSLSFGINRNQNKVTYKLTTLTTPSIFAITFAEFMNQDIDARKQRLILYQIYSAEVIRNNNGLSPRQKKEVRGKDSKSSFGKFNTFLKSKKKKPSLNAIHDNRTSTACKLLEDISPSTIKKKKPIDTNSCFLHAMANGLEAVCLILYEKGFPSNVNLPAVSATISVQSLSNNLKTKMTSISALGGNEPFMFPSYFMMAVGVGLDNVVRAMMKRANVNQTWYGLTPLQMACCKGSQSVIRGLLENGAEVHTGIFAETYKLLLKLKSNNAKLAPGLTSLKGYNRQWVRDGSKQTKETLRLPDQNEASTINSCSFPLEFWRSKRIYPIELASANHQIDTVKLLLQKYDQKTILNLSFCFLINPSLETACAFLKAGAKIELQVDPKGSNPLHVAARTGKLGLVIAYLTFCKTDINYRGENNWTALHEATSLKHMAVVQYLIKSGADASLLTKDGLTAHQIAVEVGIEEIKPFTADELHIQDLVKQFTMADPPKEKKKKNMMNGNLSSNSVESLTLSIDSNVAPIIKGHKSPEIGFFKVFGKSSKTKIEKSERISE